MARELMRLLPLLLAGLQRALALSLPSAPAQPRSPARRGTEEPYPHSKFPCGDDIYIPSVWLCDGDKDCADGRDEAHCFNNCPNGTDEQLVDCKKHHLKMSSLQCTKQEFHCTSGECIPYVWVCDGHPDCASGNDELHCRTAGAPSNQTTTLAVSPTPGNGSTVPSGNQSASGITMDTGVTQTTGDQTTTPGHGSLTPSERRSAYGLVMAAAYGNSSHFCHLPGSLRSSQPSERCLLGA
ncbi:CD320 antigen isoform X2 [Notamacropus eugenii]|uniref:CD320 antigen isoform X2 n=1 Tax=Notamacropus eugenii TaxID=9315 RepID=UPI003B67258D